jgi:hypothetical protein
MDQYAVRHVKASENGGNFLENVPFVMLGHNVTAKLDKKYMQNIRLWEKILQ